MAWPPTQFIPVPKVVQQQQAANARRQAAWNEKDPRDVFYEESFGWPILQDIYDFLFKAGTGKLSESSRAQLQAIHEQEMRRAGATDVQIADSRREQKALKEEQDAEAEAAQLWNQASSGFGDLLADFGSGFGLDRAGTQAALITVVVVVIGLVAVNLLAD